MKASQSDGWVGNKPIDWHLYNAKIILTKFPMKNINFWPHACVPSIVLNAVKNRYFKLIFKCFIYNNYYKICKWSKHNINTYYIIICIM